MIKYNPLNECEVLSCNPLSTPTHTVLRHSMKIPHLVSPGYSSQYFIPLVAGTLLNISIS